MAHIMISCSEANFAKILQICIEYTVTGLLIESSEQLLIVTLGPVVRIKPNEIHIKDLESYGKYVLPPLLTPFSEVPYYHHHL